METIKIQNTNLGEMRGRFITEIELESLHISGCRMTLENEDILELSVNRFIFVNNLVEVLVTEALQLRVSELALIVNNTFQHLQLKSFTDVAPLTKSSAMEIKSNSVENFESGFLIINQNWKNLEIENLRLEKRCDCHLRLFSTDQLEVINNDTVIDTLVKNTFCIGENMSGKF